VTSRGGLVQLGRQVELDLDLLAGEPDPAFRPGRAAAEPLRSSRLISGSLRQLSSPRRCLGG
jgi:hypothetical protein